MALSFFYLWNGLGVLPQVTPIDRPATPGRKVPFRLCLIPLTPRFTGLLSHPIAVSGPLNTFFGKWFFSPQFQGLRAAMSFFILPVPPPPPLVEQNEFPRHSINILIAPEADLCLLVSLFDSFPIK